MAYGNNNGNTKQTVYETYATVFGDKKAYTFGMSNGKFRLAVASLIPNNGNPQWDFKNQQGITLDSEDLNRVLLACKQLIHIYLAVHSNPGIAATNPIYSTRIISVPLVAKSTGNPYGEFSVGFKPLDGGQDDTFYFQFETSSPRDGSVSKDWFYFRQSLGNEGKLVFRNDAGVEMKSTDHKQLMFANFVRMLEWSLNLGKIGYGIHTALKYSGGGSSYRGNSNYGGNGGSSWNNGGNSGGYGNDGGNGGGNYPGDDGDDMPF